ncbi:MAG: DNA methyltransferase [Minicystis sp.]
MSERVQDSAPVSAKPSIPTSTVGRGKRVVLRAGPEHPHFADDLGSTHFGDALACYAGWPAPVTIVSDGAYGVLGFDGDTADHLDVPRWYEPHVEAWARASTLRTTLWFWNSEIGWAAAHPVLERYGFRYVGCNVWNKGVGHIAGNVNTGTIRRFPVVTEVCVQYVREARIGERSIKRWLLDEWQRTGLHKKQANKACGVKDAASRKYLEQGHLWYFPPPEAMEKLCEYANRLGDPGGRPYFSLDGQTPVSPREWLSMRASFRCPHGVTNVWERGPVRGDERVTVGAGRAVHLNQKPLDLMRRIIEASTEEGDVVWEPFGGLFSASVAARALGRRAFAAEIDPTYYQYGLRRITRGEAALIVSEIPPKPAEND